MKRSLVTVLSPAAWLESGDIMTVPCDILCMYYVYVIWGLMTCDLVLNARHCSRFSDWLQRRRNGIQHLILCLSVLHPSCMSLSEETHFSCLVQGTDTSGISNQHLFVTLPLGLSAMCAFLKGSVCGK
ncbi:hypothetical protein RRG08_063423 [Elysia crispata]|uniref:Uncharacterized protein n=1 Tax=Elysia crispata TaxID=231223 RepID=A0AAE1AB35_9GAST|nr:hypothetical protein RRG08_063423 [Elysia crispata]